MLDPLDENNLRETLLAFADGELDTAGSAEALDFLVAHPEWLQVLRDQQRLREEVRRVVQAGTPAMSESFRARIAALGQGAVKPDLSAQTQGNAGARPPRISGEVRRLLSWPAAAAAVLALGLGLLAGSNLFPRQGLPVADKTPTLAPDPMAPAVPPILVAEVTRVHVDCSRFGLSGHAGPFPSGGSFASLAADVRNSFKTTVPYPDLSSVGYEFVGAGPCAKPLDNTVHLLYRTTLPNQRDTLSILVQPYAGQVKLSPRTFAPSGLSPGQAAHPGYVWRTEAAVYFLVTDDAPTAEKARDVLQLASSR